MFFYAHCVDDNIENTYLSDKDYPTKKYSIRKFDNKVWRIDHTPYENLNSFCGCANIKNKIWENLQNSYFIQIHNFQCHSENQNDEEKIINITKIEGPLIKQQNGTIEFASR